MRRWIVVLLLLAFLPCSANEPRGGEVRVGSRIVLTVPAPVGTISASERAHLVNTKLAQILENATLDPNGLTVELDSEGVPVIRLGEISLLGVTKTDAEAYGKTQEELAEQWSRRIKLSLVQLKPLYKNKEQKISVKFLSEHRVFLLLLQVSTLLLLAHFCGECLRRLNQPPVLGHLLAGILLGPSLLGWLTPTVRALLFPESQTQSYLLEVVSWLGMVLLLGLTGLEIDVGLIRRQGRPAFWASLFGIAFPFASGLALGLVVPDFVLTDPGTRIIFALFLATAMSISSVPVVAKILMDMGLLRQTVGQTIMAAAVIDDTIGWIVMAFLAGLITTGTLEVSMLLKTVGGTVLYVLMLFVVLRPVLFTVLRWIRNTVPSEEVLLALVLAVIMLNAAVTQFLGVHAVLGAFLAGMLLRQWPYARELMEERVEGLTLALFAPIFFAAAGIHVDVRVLADPVLLKLTLVSTAVACFGKIVGCFLGGRIGGLGAWEALSLGIGMNARGAMGLIIAVLGFSLGILTVSMFSVIVMVALATTVITPPLLRWSLQRVERKHEPIQAGRPDSAQALRVLLATRGGAGASSAALMMSLLHAQRPVSLTVMTSGPYEEAVASLRESMQGRGLESTLEHRPAGRPGQAIARLASNFDLVAVGAKPIEPSSGVFGRTVDEIVQLTECPVLIVAANHPLNRLGRIMLATTGSPNEARMIELVCWLARSSAAELDIVHVLEIPTENIFWSPDRVERARQIATDILAQLARRAQDAGLSPSVHLLEGESAGPALAEFASKTQADVCFLRTERRTSTNLFLGPTLSYLLSHNPCALTVLVE